MGIWGKSLGVISPHLLVALLVVIVPFTGVLAACGDSSGVADDQKSESPAVQKSESPSVAGMYKLKNPQNAYQGKAKLILGHDMTAKMTNSGESLSGTYEVNDGEIAITFTLTLDGETTRLPGTVEGDRIVLGGKAIWVRQQ